MTRRIMRKIKLAGTMLLFSVSLSFSQQNINLTFRDAVRLALENNITLQQEKNNLIITKANRNQSRALYLPNLSANSQVMHINGQQFDMIKGAVAFIGSERAGATFEAYYTLFDGMGRSNLLKQNTGLMISQQNMVERTEQQIIFNVADQYLQALLDRELLRIVEQNLELQNTTLRQIQGFVLAGTRPLSNQLDQEAEVKKIEVGVIRAQNKLRIDKAILSQTLMLDAGIEIEPAEPDWSFESILATQYIQEELYQTALQNRPDYIKALSDQESANAAVAVGKAGYFPSLNAFFQYGSNYSSLVTDPETLERVPFNQQFFKDNPTSAVGLQLDIPIFNQYRTVQQKTRAKMLYENSQLAEENLKLTIYREVQNAILNMDASKNEYFASESQFEAALEAYKIQRERFEVGVGNLVELSQSNRILVEAAASRAQAKYTLLFQKVILDYYTGTLDPSGLL